MLPKGTLLEVKLYGRIPSKKNSRRNFRGNSIPSERFVEWHNLTRAGIMEWLPNIAWRAPEHPVAVDILFEFPDRGKADLTNKAESVMDLLVDCGILRDDSWRFVPEIRLRFAGEEKISKNPLTTVRVEEYDSGDRKK